MTGRSFVSTPLLAGEMAITPHEKAPTLLRMGEDERQRVLRELLVAVLSKGLTANNQEELRLVREACYVSLFFFLRGVASYSGPYEKLTPHLHLDMANFYQWTMVAPWRRAAGFIGRGHYKSSVWTHGAHTWLLLRDPEYKIALGSAIFDRARGFMQMTRANFESNDLIQALFPECVPGKGQKRWNNDEIVMPNRKRWSPDASLKPIAVGGSTQGIHVNLLDFDDPVGEQQINAERMATLEMYRIKNYLQQSIRVLLTDFKRDRVFVKGTRWSVDDAYDFVLEDVAFKWGYWDEIRYPTREKGQWAVYYRLAREPDTDGRVAPIFPENFDDAYFEEAMEKDWWTYITQMMNNPQAASIAELSDLPVSECTLDMVEGQWVVRAAGLGTMPLSSLDVVLVLDPAATSRGITARTSRSALLLMAQDAFGHLFVLDGKVGYYDIMTVFGYVFDLWKKYDGCIRVFGMEQQGAFKVLEGPWNKERLDRGVMIPTWPIATTTEKDSRIRAAIVPYAKGGKFHATKEMRTYVKEEMISFPGGIRKDVLDAVSLGVGMLVRPLTKERIELDEEDAEERASIRNRVTGY